MPGNIISQVASPIAPEETSVTLMGRLFELGGTMLEEVFPKASMTLTLRGTPKTPAPLLSVTNSRKKAGGFNGSLAPKRS